jgi:hypothetical protein
MAQFPYLARLRALQPPTFEFALGLEPIVQLKFWPFTAFEINFGGAKPEFFVT